MLRQQTRLISFLSMVYDALLVCLSFYIAYNLRVVFEPNLPVKEIGAVHEYYWIVLAAVPIWIALMRHSGLYDSLRTRGYFSVVWSIFKASVLGLVLLGFAVLFLDREHFSRSLRILRFAHQTSGWNQ